jgi:hypothetical protein
MWTTRARSASAAFFPRRLPADKRTQGFSSVRAVGSQLPKVTKKAFEKYGFHSAEIITAWPTIAGPALASISTPDRIKWPRRDTAAAGDGGRSGGGATLHLAVAAAHALDVQYQAGEIVGRINRYFGYQAIARVEIRQAATAVRQPAEAERAVAAYPVATSPAPDLESALDGLRQRISQERRTTTAP